jgi:cytochrome b6-f complex iron-sulfur subunit
VALSAVCTHLGCVLRWKEDAQLFNCPCHNADFNSEGVIQPTPDYPWTPPPLPVLQVKVEDGQVWVLGTSDPPPVLRHHDHPA